jgi:hypothetical protein
MFLNSTRNGVIQIKDLDQEIEGEEPFQSRIGLGNFGAKRPGTFAGWIRVMKPVVLFNKRESEISQCDISPPVWGCLPIRKNSKTNEMEYTQSIEINIHNTKHYSMCHYLKYHHTECLGTMSTVPLKKLAIIDEDPFLHRV